MLSFLSVATKNTKDLGRLHPFVGSNHAHVACPLVIADDLFFRMFSTSILALHFPSHTPTPNFFCLQSTHCISLHIPLPQFFFAVFKPPKTCIKSGVMRWSFMIGYVSCLSLSSLSLSILSCSFCLPKSLICLFLCVSSVSYFSDDFPKINFKVVRLSTIVDDTSSS